MADSFGLKIGLEGEKELRFFVLINVASLGGKVI